MDIENLNPRYSPPPLPVPPDPPSRLSIFFRVVAKVCGWLLVVAVVLAGVLVYQAGDISSAGFVAVASTQVVIAYGVCKLLAWLTE